MLCGIKTLTIYLLIMEPGNLVVAVSIRAARKIGSVPHGNYHISGLHCEVWSLCEHTPNAYHSKVIMAGNWKEGGNRSLQNFSSLFPDKQIMIKEFKVQHCKLLGNGIVWKILWNSMWYVWKRIQYLIKRKFSFILKLNKSSLIFKFKSFRCFKRFGNQRDLIHWN